MPADQGLDRREHGRLVQRKEAGDQRVNGIEKNIATGTLEDWIVGLAMERLSELVLDDALLPIVLERGAFPHPHQLVEEHERHQ